MANPTLTVTIPEENNDSSMSLQDAFNLPGFLKNDQNTQIAQPSPTTAVAPTVAPVATGGGSSSAPAPTYEPTIGEQLTGIQNEALRIQDILNQRQAEEQAAAVGPFQSPTSNAYPTFEELYGEPIDAEEVNRSTLKMFQDQIDATNAVYDQLLADERLRGEGRLGSQRAITARGGLLGSDFAGAQKARVQDYNTGQQRLIGAERQAAIGAILGTARREAAQAIADKRAARQQGAENYLSYLANSQANRLNNVTNVAQAIIAQGLNPEEMDEQELAAIASEIGATPADIITAYQANLPETAQGGEFGFMSTSGGIFRTDPATGEAVFIPSGSGGTTSGSRSTSATQATTGGDQSTTTTTASTQPDITFDEFIQQKQEEQQMSFTPEYRESFRDEYNSLSGGTRTVQPSLTNLTTSKKQSLEQSGLLNASGDVQTFFLNAPNDFQSFYSRGVALGNFGGDVSAAELQQILEAYEEEESGGSGREI